MDLSGFKGRCEKARQLIAASNDRLGVCDTLSMVFRWMMYESDVNHAVQSVDGLFDELFHPLFSDELSLTTYCRAYWLDLGEDRKNIDGRLLCLDIFEQIMIESELYKEIYKI